MCFGILLALFSYLFYALGVAIIAGVAGYAIGTGLMAALGITASWLLILIGLIVAVAIIVATFRFNLQKWVIIVATSVMGAVTIAGTFGLLFSPSARMIEQPVQAVVRASPLLVPSHCATELPLPLSAIEPLAGAEMPFFSRK